MKKFITLCVALIATIIVSAQQPMAILDHNDSISVFYGANALVDAYNASVDGDIITLSSGTFNSITTTHNNVTIRGAGMFEDTVTGMQPTIVVGNTRIRHHFNTFEGIHFSSEVDVRDNTNHFNKCRFSYIGYEDGNGAYSYEYRQCVIESMSIVRHRNARFYNCIVLGIGSGDLSYNNQFYNCIMQLNPNNIGTMAEFHSCIFWYNNCQSGTNNVSTDCIGVTPCGSYFSSNSNNLVNRSFADTFVNFTGNYVVGVSDLHLTPEAQAFLGIDSTQVGIYGGFYPYEPRVDAVPPIIGRVTVPNHSNAEGRLDVNVEIINAQ